MANLIITVISIALVAVAALMGAYYGGSAFMDGQANSQANTYVAQAEQIGSAWRLYTIDNGGSHDFVGLPDSNFFYTYNAAIKSAFVPKYLNSFPKAPNSLTEWGMASGNDLNRIEDIWETGQRYAYLVVQMPNSDGLDRLCIAINNLGKKRDLTLPYDLEVDTLWTTTDLNGESIVGNFACVITEQTSAFFVYKVF